MGIRKGNIVRVTLNGHSPIGQYYKVKNVEGKLVYCSPIENGHINEAKTFLLNKQKLISIPFAGSNTSRKDLESFVEYPQHILELQISPTWENIIKKRRERQDMLIHLYCNKCPEIWIKYLSAIRTGNDRITLFGVQVIC